MGKKNSNKGNGVTIHHPSTYNEFTKIHSSLLSRRFAAIDTLKPGTVRDISLALGDAANAGAEQMAAGMGCGAWSTGPLSKVAWAFDGRDNTVHSVKDSDGKELGLGYVDWGAGNNVPSVIPPLAMSSPYTAAPLRYIADLISGLGVRLMYRFPDGKLVQYKDAGDILKQKVRDLEKQNPVEDVIDEVNGVVAMATGSEQQARKENPELKDAKEALDKWTRIWYGYEELDNPEEEDEKKHTYTHIPGAKEFLEDNNLDLHLSQCMQDHVMLDIHFPTVGLQRGRKGPWNPKVVQVGHISAATMRIEKQNEHGHSNHCYRSEQWRTLGIGSKVVTDPDNQKIVMYPACMPQHLLSDLKYIVESNQKTRIKARPTWVVCPTFYPSLNKPYYPQPAWWSVFTSKAFDFSATILYDKYKARENSTSWGKIIYISLDYLNMVFGDMGIEGNKDAQDKYIEELDQNIEQFLQQRENNGKMMRQFMWEGKDSKQNKNIEIVDVAETVKDAVQAGKDELELATSPIFLALGIDPRLVGVPMVKSSNGGTAVRELHLLKQQQLNIHQRLYLNWLNTAVCAFNGWTESNAEFHIVQQTLTTLDNSKTGTVETIAGEEA